MNTADGVSGHMQPMTQHVVPVARQRAEDLGRTTSTFSQSTGAL